MEEQETVVLTCGCRQIKVGGKWFMDEYCKEHDELDECGFEVNVKPMKKFRLYDTSTD